MTYLKITIVAHRRDYLERLPNEEYNYTLISNSLEDALEWAEEKATEIEYGPDKHVMFCDYKAELKNE